MSPKSGFSEDYDVLDQYQNVSKGVTLLFLKYKYYFVLNIINSWNPKLVKRGCKGDY